MTTHQDTICRLLLHYPDWLVASGGDGRSDQKGSRLLLHDETLDCGHLYSPLAELDRVLTLMRDESRGKLGRLEIVFTKQGGPKDGARMKCSLASARWHMLAYCIPERYVMVRRPVREKGKWVKRDMVEPVRHPEARKDRAMAGVDWCAARFDWRRTERGMVLLAKDPSLRMAA